MQLVKLDILPSHAMLSAAGLSTAGLTGSFFLFLLIPVGFARVY